jgi:hypothetical protein
MYEGYIRNLEENGIEAGELIAIIRPDLARQAGIENIERLTNFEKVGCIKFDKNKWIYEDHKWKRVTEKKNEKIHMIKIIK